jgi:hypothetical protein
MLLSLLSLSTVGDMVENVSDVAVKKLAKLVKGGQIQPRDLLPRQSAK